MAGKVGRPAIKRSEELAKRIKGMAAFGVTHEDIAKTAGMSPDVLVKLYGEELKTAAIEANAQVAGMLFKQCQEGNVTAQIFWLKTRAKWSEKTEVELTGKDGAPLQTAGVMVVGAVMTPEEWTAAAKTQQEGLTKGV